MKTIRVVCVVLLMSWPSFAHSSPAKDKGALRVQIARNGYHGSLQLAVGRTMPGQQPPEWILRRKLADGTSKLTIPNLDAGNYLVLLSGREPLEFLGEDVALSSGTTRPVKLSISMGTVLGRFRLAGAPLVAAQITLQKPKTRWRSIVSTDANGEFRSRSWIDGTVHVSIHSPALPSNVSRRLELRPNGTFEVDLPDRTISGRVTEPSGAPLADVSVFLTSQFEDYTTSARARTDLNGVFDFPAVFPGTHILTAEGAGYLDSGELPVDIEEADHKKEAPIILQPARTHAVDVVDTDGKAVAGASVTCVSGDVVISKTTTDAAGHAVVSAPLAGSSVLYAFAPRSFAVARFEAAETSTRIRLPRANASLTLNTVTPDGQPLPAVFLLVRFDGELIPHQVVEEAERRNLFTSRTSADGRLRWTAVPVGTYEFWPYRTMSEADEITRSISLTDAPISLHAAAGENNVTVTFRQRFQ
jgi:protocatechuate 3,4-dioxygenase beta subunit